MQRLRVVWSVWRKLRQRTSGRPFKAAGTLELLPSLHDLQAVDEYIRQYVQAKIDSDEGSPGLYTIRWHVQQKVRFHTNGDVRIKLPPATSVGLRPGQIYCYGDNWLRIDWIDPCYIKGYVCREIDNKILEGEFVVPSDGRLEKWLVDQGAQLVMRNVEREE